MPDLSWLKARNDSNLDRTYTELELATKETRDPDWAREELILTLDLYFRRGRKQLDANDPEVLQMSELLNELTIHPSILRTKRFRNPNGVSMKLGNFLSVDPAYGGVGLSQGSQLERQIWKEFADKPEELAQAANAIKINKG